MGQPGTFDAVKNVAGGVFGVLDLAMAARNGNLANSVIGRQIALSDPAVRASLQGASFASGVLGVGGSTVPQFGPDPNAPAPYTQGPQFTNFTELPIPGGVAPGQAVIQTGSKFIPNLPPTTRALQQKAQGFQLPDEVIATQRALEAASGQKSVAAYRINPEGGTQVDLTPSPDPAMLQRFVDAQGLPLKGISINPFDYSKTRVELGFSPPVQLEAGSTTPTPRNPGAPIVNKRDEQALAIKRAEEENARRRAQGGTFNVDPTQNIPGAQAAPAVPQGAPPGAQYPSPAFADSSIPVGNIPIPVGNIPGNAPAVFGSTYGPVYGLPNQQSIPQEIPSQFVSQGTTTIYPQADSSQVAANERAKGLTSEPAAIVTTLSGVANAAAQLLSMARAHPELVAKFIGPFDQAALNFRLASGLVTENDQFFNTFRNALAGIQKSLFGDSGKAVTAPELTILQPGFPDPAKRGGDANLFLDDLYNFANNAGAQLQMRLGALGEGAPPGIFAPANGALTRLAEQGQAFEQHPPVAQPRKQEGLLRNFPYGATAGSYAGEKGGLAAAPYLGPFGPAAPFVGSSAGAVLGGLGQRYYEGQPLLAGIPGDAAQGLIPPTLKAGGRAAVGVLRGTVDKLASAAASVGLKRTAAATHLIAPEATQAVRGIAARTASTLPDAVLTELRVVADTLPAYQQAILATGYRSPAALKALFKRPGFASLPLEVQQAVSAITGRVLPGLGSRAAAGAVNLGVPSARAAFNTP